MKITLSAIKHMIRTGAAVDWTRAEIVRRPFNSTIIFHSIGANGLNGLVIRDDSNGALYAVVDRCSNLFILAY